MNSRKCGCSVRTEPKMYLSSWQSKEQQQSYPCPGERPEGGQGEHHKGPPAPPAGDGLYQGGCCAKNMARRDFSAQSLHYHNVNTEMRRKHIQRR